jgi:arylsulfatase A-like enzyme
VANLRQDLDGMDQWDALVYNLASPRRELLHNIDESGRTAAIRSDSWKLVIGKGMSPLSSRLSSDHWQQTATSGHPENVHMYLAFLAVKLSHLILQLV